LARDTEAMFRRKCEAQPIPIERGEVEAILWGLADVYATVLSIERLLQEEEDEERDSGGEG